MSYNDLWALANDAEFLQRCAASVAEQSDQPDPYQWVFERRFELAATPGFADQYASALSMVPAIQTPGKWESVITDAQIASAVATILQGPAKQGGDEGGAEDER